MSIRSSNGRTGRRGPPRLAAALRVGLLAPSLLAPSALAQQPPPLAQDDQAALLLNAGRRAYNDRNYPQAINSFREFTGRFGGHEDAPAAWYGLGLALLDGPRDHPAAAEALRQAAAAQASPDRPLALYFLGVALRGQGNAEARAAPEKPAEAGQRRDAARQRFEEAAAQFAAAAAALAEVRKPAAGGQAASAAEWVARARCDQADVLVRAGKPTEAAAAVQPVVDDASLAESPLRPLALYHLGHARFAQKEYAAAGRALSRLAPFDQAFGLHARYLLARAHHLSDERPEAAAQYAAVLAGAGQQRAAARQQLEQGGDKLAADQRAFLESLASGPTPDYVPRAAFYQAVLLGDDGKFPEAKGLFLKLAADAPKHPLAAESRARAGFCLLQAKQFKEAADALGPLKDDAALGDQVGWWLARAQLGQAVANDPAGVEAAAKGAIDLLRRSAEQAGKLAERDPAAKTRQADILLDLADAQVQAKQFREAAATYRQVADDAAAAPERAEEAAQRLVTALHLAGDYPASDAAAEAFERRYPKSTLLPAAWFRSAENAYLAAAATAARPDADKADLDRQFGTALLRYQKVLERFPEFPQANLARQGMAQCLARLGKHEQAAAVLAKIPDADRAGELAAAAYLQADALVRTFPPEAEDAVSAAGLIQTAEGAAKLLEGFAAADPKGPLVPDALLRYGYCYQRMAGLLAERPERDKALQTAREAYERHLNTFRDHPTAAAVRLERAKVLALQGDAGGAASELQQLMADPKHKAAANAPLVALRRSVLMRAQGQAKEAAELMAKARAEHDAVLAKDLDRSAWVPMLAYEHGLAVKESGKLPEARKLFEELAGRHAGQPDGVNAAWRAVQCRREELAVKLTDARRKLGVPSAKRDDVDAAARAVEEVARGLTDAAAPLAALHDKLAQEKAPADAVQRVLYELAWCDRQAGEAEADLARHKARLAAAEKVAAKLPKRDGQPPVAVMAGPDVVVPPTAGEQRARERYGKLIAAAPDAPLAAKARFELAELAADRGEHDAAVELLNAALLTAPPADFAERVRLRLAACFLAKGDATSAVAAAKPIADAVRESKPTPLQAEARFLLAEAAVQGKQWPRAVELLAPFRDQDALRALPGVSDRALLRLGQAHAAAGQWDQARQAFEAVVQRFGDGPWADEGRFGVGLAHLNQNRHDDAANAFAEVTRRTVAEVAARAQVHVGLARMAQKKYPEAAAAFLAVPYTYDYPEWSAAACLEAARAYEAMKQPADAAGLLKRVVERYPDTPSAAVARTKLDGRK